MDNGYIKLFRKIQKWEWYTDSTTFHLFIHLLLSANYEDGRWMGNEILRGQLITGLKKLHQQAGISIQSLRTSLAKLKSTGEITIKSTNKFSIITVCNYNSYQFQNCDTNSQINSLTNKQLTNNQQATNKQLTTNNNNKEVKNNKKEKKYNIYSECVKLTSEEHEKLINQFGEQGTVQRIQNLNDYIMSKGTRYKSHYHTILNWERRNGSQPKKLTREESEQKLLEELRKEFPV